MPKSEGKRLRMNLDPKLFTDRVECPADLKELLRDSIAIVSIKDIHTLQVNNEGEIKIQKLSERAFLSILRATRDGKDVQVYKDAKIELRFTEICFGVAHQTFAEVGKLASLNAFNIMLKSHIGVGVSSAPPLAITYRNVEGRYIAFYMPPIIEAIPKHAFGKILERVNERVVVADELRLSPVDGIKPISLAVLYERARQIVGKSPGLNIPVVVDGTHRVIAQAITGSSRTSYNSILINGSKRTASSMPVRVEDIVFVREKPPRREDRFPGLSEDGFHRFKDVGIDN